jgi:hypothetical protein
MFTYNNYGLYLLKIDEVDIESREFFDKIRNEWNSKIVERTTTPFKSNLAIHICNKSSLAYTTTILSTLKPNTRS